MTGSGEIGPSDDLRMVVAGHQRSITDLGQRIAGLESGLMTVHRDIANVQTDMKTGFTDVMGMMREHKAEQGPKFGEIIKMVLSGGALISMSAAAITILVTSFVSPDLTALEGKQLTTLYRMDEMGQKLSTLNNRFYEHTTKEGHPESVIKMVNALEKAHGARLDRIEREIDDNGIGRWATRVNK